jgi:hypothetical protein
LGRKPGSDQNKGKTNWCVKKGQEREKIDDYTPDISLMTMNVRFISEKISNKLKNKFEVHKYILY